MTPDESARKNAQNDVMNLVVLLAGRLRLGKIHDCGLQKGFFHNSQVLESYAGFLGLDMGYDTSPKNILVMWASDEHQGRE